MLHGQACRIEQLRRIGEMLAERESDFVDALVTDLRRASLDAELLDITPTRGELRHAQKNLRQWMRQHRVAAPITAKPGRARYEYEPLGVVLMIGP